jgi:hypothetical protein
MNVTLANGRKLKLTFVHSSPDFKTRADAGEFRIALDSDAARIGRRITLCNISEVGDTPDQTVLIGQGVALCHPNDTFNKAKGRKLALTYALAAAEAAGVSRNDRRAVWNVYLTPPVK